MVSLDSLRSPLSYQRSSAARFRNIEYDSTDSAIFQYVRDSLKFVMTVRRRQVVRLPNQLAPYKALCRRQYRRSRSAGRNPSLKLTRVSSNKFQGSGTHEESCHCQCSHAKRRSPAQCRAVQYTRVRRAGAAPLSVS